MVQNTDGTVLRDEQCSLFKAMYHIEAMNLVHDGLPLTSLSSEYCNIKYEMWGRNVLCEGGGVSAEQETVVYL